ncbi:helix-turn-helix domain-containing protein [Catenibacterium mitsuokai]|uniref:helix-turn-helix domain-containing protein n=1 Tax=Catenibacterium mitsuokai TaxID=100886 RepID=UPI003D04D6CB
MKVSYKKLFKLLIDKDMKKTEFAKKIGIGQNTLAKLSKNENVSMEVLIKICEGLNCKIEDVVEFVNE